MFDYTTGWKIKIKISNNKKTITIETKVFISCRDDPLPIYYMFKKIVRG